MNWPANLWNKNKIWPSAVCPFVRGIWLIVYAVFHFGFTAPSQAPMFVDPQKPLEVIYGELRNVTVSWKVCYFYILNVSSSIKFYYGPGRKCCLQIIPNSFRGTRGKICHLITIVSYYPSVSDRDMYKDRPRKCMFAIYIIQPRLLVPGYYLFPSEVVTSFNALLHWAIFRASCLATFESVALQLHEQGCYSVQWHCQQLAKLRPRRTEERIIRILIGWSSKALRDKLHGRRCCTAQRWKSR